MAASPLVRVFEAIPQASYAAQFQSDSGELIVEISGPGEEVRYDGGKITPKHITDAVARIQGAETPLAGEDVDFGFCGHKVLARFHGKREILRGEGIACDAVCVSLVCDGFVLVIVSHYHHGGEDVCKNAAKKGPEARFEAIESIFRYAAENKEKH